MRINIYAGLCLNYLTSFLLQCYYCRAIHKVYIEGLHTADWVAPSSTRMITIRSVGLLLRNKLEFKCQISVSRPVSILSFLKFFFLLFVCPFYLILKLLLIESQGKEAKDYILLREGQVFKIPTLDGKTLKESTITKISTTIHSLPV